MALWSQREKGYKISVIVMAVACFLSTLGIALPGWWTIDTSFGTSYSGLYMVCSKGYSTCVRITGFDTGLPGYFWTCLILAPLGVIFIMLSLLSSLIRDCCSTTDVRTRSGYLAFSGGIKLMICVIIFGAYNNDYFLYTSSIAFSYGPSFYITITGSILAIVSGIMTAHFQRLRATAPYSNFTINPTATIVQTTAQSNVYFSSNNAPGMGYNNPAAYNTNYAVAPPAYNNATMVKS